MISKIYDETLLAANELYPKVVAVGGDANLHPKMRIAHAKWAAAHRRGLVSATKQGDTARALRLQLGIAPLFPSACAFAASLSNSLTLTITSVLHARSHFGLFLRFTGCCMTLYVIHKAAETHNAVDE